MSSIFDFFRRDRKSYTTLDLFKEVFGGRETLSGRSITVQQALQISTIYAGLRVLGDGVGQVPLKVMRKTGNSREDVPEFPLYDVLYAQPNEFQTSFEYREMMMMHLVLCTNHFSFINRVRGKVVELLPFEPGQVTVKRGNAWDLSYLVRANDGTERTIVASDMLHVRGPSWNGWMGLEMVTLAREALGLALALEEQQATLANNGAQASGMYSVEGTLSDKQYKDLAKWIKDNYEGAANAGKTMIIDRGAKYVSRAMTSVDAQTLESRRFAVEEVCRFMRIMPIMVGASDKTATYASAEQMFLAHVVHTLSPWYSRLEQKFQTSLLTKEERRAGYYIKFNANGLLRGSHKDRGDYYAKALGSGGSRPWMTQDEVRELEESNPMGGAAAVLHEPAGSVVKSDTSGEDDAQSN